MSSTVERMPLEAQAGRNSADFEPMSASAARTLEAEMKTSLSCPVDFSAQSRALFATDASNYRQVPIGVVTPKTRDDVVDAVRICRAHRAPIVPRGGGTSLVNVWATGRDIQAALCAAALKAHAARLPDS